MLKFALLALAIAGAAVFLFVREGPKDVPAPSRDGGNQPVHIEPPNPLGY